MTYSVERLLWLLNAIHHTATNTFEPDVEIIRMAEAGLNGTALAWESHINTLSAEAAQVTPFDDKAHEQHEPADIEYVPERGWT